MAQVSKWGNSLAIRLPSKVVKAMDLKEGDELSFGVSEAGREFVGRKAIKPLTAVEKARMIAVLDDIRSRIKAPENFKFDRQEANQMERFDKWGPDGPEPEG